MNMLKIEKKYWDSGYTLIAGIDEAGRGPLAGPVVAACVIFDKKVFIEGIKDSKKISAKKREVLYEQIIKKSFDYSVSVINENIIDDINILKATHHAMKCSLGGLKQKPDLVLIDGLDTGLKHYKTKHIVNGDNLSHSIAAASIIAKVTRDRIMCEYDKVFPSYKFSNHKGYGTKYHMEYIRNMKATIIHRKSFKIVNENLPSVKFINENYGFGNFGKQYVAVKYIKKGFTINTSSMNTENDTGFDFHFIKDASHIFTLIYTRIDNIEINCNKSDFNKSFLKIVNYLNEKDMRFDFTFYVILVTVLKNKKPIIKNIYNEKFLNN